MFIVLSNPTPIGDEAAILNSLFEEGMELFHLRKPNAGIEEIRRLVEKIKPQYRTRIALHQHHELATELGIHRLHFTEEKRNVTDEKRFIELKEKEYVVSTSIHAIKEYKKLSSSFDYVFFGPVFDSISKQGYTSTITSDFVFPIEKALPKVIAIGGVDVETLAHIKKMNFSGAAVLGTIWQHPEKSIAQFKIVQKAWKQLGQ